MDTQEWAQRAHRASPMGGTSSSSLHSHSLGFATLQMRLSQCLWPWRDFVLCSFWRLGSRIFLPLAPEEEGKAAGRVISPPGCLMSPGHLLSL